ncbi:Casein kinase I isoform delta [Orchesella cincta]|uniref:non-specific serine/threonine protein kinase n=1 Tax=Orchesella cincta TaxID=48709 RepID=A0A1D2ND09_ORCCI|nr:Casein kinase I isoform delta [Orchesella cincta]
MGENSKILINRFVVGGVIGSGSFGVIKLGYDLEKKRKVAIKFQLRKITADRNLTNSLEYTALKDLQVACPGHGFPEVYYLHENVAFNEQKYFVMELCGPSIWDLFFIRCKKSFTLKTILMLVDQLIALLEQLHTAGYIHRDLKPDNMVMGYGSNVDTVYLVDFGLAQKYKNDKENETGSNSKDKFAGTIAFASANALEGKRQSPRDDMESLAYSILMLIRGGVLPWCYVFKEEEDIMERVAEIKRRLSPEEMFAGLPYEFALYLKMVRELEYDDTPQYQVYRQVFRNLAYCLNYNYDLEFDWKVRRVWNGGETHTAKINVPS